MNRHLTSPIQSKTANSILNAKFENGFFHAQMPSSAWRDGLRPACQTHDRGIWAWKNPFSNLAFKIEMVAEDGIEPPTQGFSVLCSTD